MLNFSHHEFYNWTKYVGPKISSSFSIILSRYYKNVLLCNKNCDKNRVIKLIGHCGASLLKFSGRDIIAYFFTKTTFLHFAYFLFCSPGT